MITFLLSPVMTSSKRIKYYELSILCKEIWHISHLENSINSSLDIKVLHVLLGTSSELVILVDECFTCSFRRPLNGQAAQIGAHIRGRCRQ